MPEIVTPRRRVCLSVPGSSSKMVARARTIEVDEIVLDLEDSVLPRDKLSARARVLGALREPGWACGSVAVRVNAPRTPWCHEDVIALGSEMSRLESIVIPKVEGGADLAFVDRLLDGVRALTDVRAPLALQALVESAAGLESVTEIAGASSRLSALIIGYADLAASLGRAADAVRELATWVPAQHAVLVAARSAGVQAIDGPWLGVDADEAFTHAALVGARLGFDGKWVIHPSQIPEAERCFTPGPGEVAQARELLAGLQAADQGAIAIDGRMIDDAVAAAAQRLLTRAGVLP